MLLHRDAADVWHCCWYLKILLRWDTAADDLWGCGCFNFLPLIFKAADLRCFCCWCEVLHLLSICEAHAALICCLCYGQLAKFCDAAGEMLVLMWNGAAGAGARGAADPCAGGGGWPSPPQPSQQSLLRTTSQGSGRSASTMYIYSMRYGNRALGRNTLSLRLGMVKIQSGAAKGQAWHTEKYYRALHLHGRMQITCL